MKRSTLISSIGTAVGIALYVVIGLFTEVPIGFGGQRIALEYGILSAFAAAFGPIPGVAVGFIGTLLADIFLGAVWWSQILAAMLMGSIIGLSARTLSLADGGFEMHGLLTFTAFTVAATLICFLLICPAFDLMIYKISFTSIYSLYLSYGATVLVGAVVLGGLLCMGLGMFCRKKPIL